MSLPVRWLFEKVNPPGGRDKLGRMTRELTLSELDEGRFGVKVARATVEAAGEVAEVLAFCREKGAALCIARTDTRRMGAVHALEEAGFRLMETAVRYAVSLREVPEAPEPAGVTLRWVQEGEAETVREVAVISFDEYEGHYRADARLDKGSCRDLYGDWAYRSCVVPNVAEDVLVAEAGGRIVSFMTLAVGPPDTWHIPLSGTLPEHQNLGLTRAMIVRCLREARARGGRRLVVVTALENLPVARHLLALGFRAKTARYTFHLWLDSR